MEINGNVQGTLLTQGSLNDLAKLVKWVETSKKELHKTLDLFDEPISQRVLELRTMIQKSATTLDKVRKEIDGALKEIVKDHNYPDYETGTLSLSFVESTRKGWNQKQADFILDKFTDLYNDFLNAFNDVNDISSPVMIKINNLIDKNGLGESNFYTTLDENFSPVVSEKVQVK